MVAGAGALRARPVYSRPEDSVPQVTFEPGAVVARRFEILRTLQSADDGAVYVVRDLRGDAGECVLKVAAGRTSAAPRAARLEREHRTLAGLRHPGVPAALDFGRDGDLDLTWFAVEQVAGPPLGRRGTLPPSYAATLFAEYLRILAYVHERGLVHCDVKPAHLLRDDGAGRAALADFDLASPARAAAPRGTPPFAAPEAVRGRPVDGRADLWSLAASFRTLLGAPPPDESGAVPPGPIAGGAPIDAVLAACLATDPDARPASARAALALLRAAGCDAPDETRATLRARLAHPPWAGGDAARLRVLGEIPAGRPRVGGVPAVIVRAPLGAGRSRLLDRLVAEWRAADVRVVRLSGAEAAGRGLSPAAALLRLLDDSVAEESAAEEGRRPGGVERLAARVCEAARARRTVLAVDDADFADRSFRDFLAHVVRRLVDDYAAGDGSVFQTVLVTRTGAASDEPLADLCESEKDSGGLLFVAPEPLAPEHVAALSLSLAEAAGVDPERVRREALRTAGGLPGGVVEAAASVAVEGANAGALGLARAAAVERLDVPAAAALCAAGMFPGGAPRDALRAVLQAAGVDADAAVAALARQGDLERRDGRFRPADPGLSSAVAASLPDPLVRTLRDAAADRLPAREEPGRSAAAILRLRGRSPVAGAAAAAAFAAALAADREFEAAFRVYAALAEAEEAPPFLRRTARLFGADAALAAGARTEAERLAPRGDDPPALLRRARLARAAGRVDAAADAFRRLLLRDDVLTRAEAAELGLELAETLSAAGRAQDARSALEAAAPLLGAGASTAQLFPPESALEDLRGPRLPWPGEDAARVARFLAVFGETSGAAGDAAGAVHALLGALKIAARLRDQALVGRIQNALGRSYLSAGRLDAAERWLRRAAAVRAEAGDAKGCADTANNLGALYRRRRRTAEAIEQFTKSLRIRRRLGHHAEEAASYHNLANVYFERRELEPATRYWRRALSLARRLSHHQRQALILNSLGAAAFMERRCEEALRCFEEAEVLARATGQTVEALEQRLNAADVLVAAGAVDRARRAVRTAAWFARRRGLAALGARAETLAARIDAQRGDRDAAVARLRAARAAETLDEQAEEIRLDLAEHLFALGEIAEARALVDERPPVAPESTARIAALRVRFALVAGEEAVRAALPELDAAAREAGRLRLPWPVFETERALAAAWRALGDRRRSAAAFRRALEALEGVLSGFGSAALLDGFCKTPDVAAFLGELETFREEAVAGRPSAAGPVARDYLRRAKDAWFDADRAVGGGEPTRGADVVRRLVDVARKLSSTTPLDDLLRDVVDAANDFSGAERCFVVLVDDRGRIRIPCARDRGREPVGDPPRQISRRVVDEALRRRAPVRFDNAMSDGALSSAASVMNLELRSVMCAPLVRSGEPFGLLYVDHRSCAGRFDDAALEFLGLFALQASVALENHRLVREFVRDEKLKLLGKLAGGVAHDFNNLLTAVLVDAQSALRRTEDPDVRTALRTIEKAARDGAAVVRRLHNVSRTSREEAFGAVDLRDAVADAVELTRAARERAAVRGGRGVDVRVDVPPGLFALGDAVEIREVLMNVALNGIAAMEHGGVLRFAGGRAEGRVFVEVVDEGAGMTEEVRESLFDPYFTTRGIDGVGLGMSVVLGIIARHQGQIRVDSAPGEGTAVRIELPPSEAPVRDAATAEDDGGGDAAAVARRADRRILVVEDDPAVRRVVSESVRAAGFRVSEANGGPEALGLLKTTRFDVVLTDLGMMPLSGWDVARAVKARDATATVYLVTGWGAEIDQETARRNGVDALLRKPFDVRRLVRLADEGVALADRRRGRSEATTGA
jgi:two-component system cell cycle sensor histidine kinase/response regulator CckA